MNKKNKIIITLLFLIILNASYFFEIKLNTSITQNLVTFFTVTFGFYITCIAIFFSTAFTKKTFQEIDPCNTSQRKIHALKKYFTISIYWALMTILLLIMFDTGNNDQKLFHSSFLIGISSVNILFIILFLNTLLNALIEEASNQI